MWCSICETEACYTVPCAAKYDCLANQAFSILKARGTPKQDWPKSYSVLVKTLKPHVLCADCVTEFNGVCRSCYAASRMKAEEVENE